MTLSFVWFWDRASEIMPNWRDGLRTALEIIGKEHEVKWFLDKTIPPIQGNDFILLWGDANCPFIDILEQYECKKGICLSAMPQDYTLLKKLDVIFCESKPILEAVRAQGLHAIKAFGTDTDFFSPDDTEKDIEYFYPATFSPWKKQSDLAYLGKKLLCVGTRQPDGLMEMEICKNCGVQIEEGYFPPEKIRDYYRRAKYVIIPAVHGSERTVLESMSMGILPSITNPKVNFKANSYIEEFNNSEYTDPREFVIHNYSAKVYARELLGGMI
jgi:hypothetical protein